VLDLSHRIKPDAELEPEESQVAEKYYPDQDLRKGIGARLIDAPRLLDRLQTARAYCPEGGAVAHAAIDWRRTGVLRRPTEADLEALYSAYLEEDFPVSAENFSRGGQPSGLFTGPRGRFWASWAVPLRRRIAG
jgi:hypothetical protein